MGAEWEIMSFVHVMFGYEAHVLGLLMSTWDYQDTEGLFIAAFLLYTFATVLMVLTTQSVGGDILNYILTIVTPALLIVAAVFLLLGVSVHPSGHHNLYAMTLEITAAGFALLTAVYLILKMVKGGKGSTSPSAVA